MATGTPVAGWWEATDAVIATALDVLEEHRAAIEKSTGKGRG